MKLVRPTTARRRLYAAAVTLALALPLALTACGDDDGDTGAPADDNAPAKVRMISWSTPRAEQANIFAAQELGYFAEENIEFEYVTGQGSGDALKQLLAGNGDIAFAGPEGVFLAVDQGADVVAIYNTYPQNAFVLVAKRESGIQTVADLKGKKIGVLSMASGGRYNTTTLLSTAGLTENDVELVAVGPAPTAFLEGQVDAFMMLSTSASRLAQTMDLVQFPVAQHVNLPTDVFVVTREVYEDPAKLRPIIRALRAIVKGTELMIEDPEQAAEIGARHGLDITDPQEALPVVKAFAEISQSDGTRANGLGWFDLDEIQAGADRFAEAGLIKKMDVSPYFTNSVLEEIHK
jgi:NitT/TauT family transport system substrate-binding protein